MSRQPCLLAVLIVVLTVKTVTASVPYFLRLGASDEECFQIRSHERRILHGTFELVASSQDDNSNTSPLPLSVLVMDYQDKALYESKPTVAYDSFRIELSASTHAYWICFQNIASDAQLPAQTLKFSFQLRPIAQEKQLPPVIVKTNPFAEEWMQLAGNVGQGMTNLQDFYDYIKDREAKHRAVHEETFSYIVSWSVAELLLVLVVAFGQLYYLRRFAYQTLPKIVDDYIFSYELVEHSKAVAKHYCSTMFDNF